MAERVGDGPGISLRDVTFVVLDLETTGTCPKRCAITEIGAAKFRGGHCLGTLATLVDPGQPVPPLVTELTGIADRMLSGAPPLLHLLPTVTDFLAGAVLVGHNVGFDVAFLEAAYEANGSRPPIGRVVDTLTLARHLLDGEVPDMKLRTLAAHFRAAHQPKHRALPDALATADVLHALIERAAGFGVFTLEALLEFPAPVPVAAAH